MSSSLEPPHLIICLFESIITEKPLSTCVLCHRHDKGFGCKLPAVFQMPRQAVHLPMQWESPMEFFYPGEDANVWVIGAISQRKCQQLTAHRKIRCCVLHLAHYTKCNLKMPCSLDRRYVNAELV